MSSSPGTGDKRGGEMTERERRNKGGRGMWRMGGRERRIGRGSEGGRENER